MIVTITNATTGPTAEELFISRAYRAVAAGSSITLTMTPAELAQETQLLALVAASKITLAFTKEAGDDIGQANQVLNAPVFTDGTRPGPTTVPAGTIIYNTTDTNLNVSDGTDWKDAGTGLTT